MLSLPSILYFASTKAARWPTTIPNFQSKRLTIKPCTTKLFQRFLIIQIAIYVISSFELVNPDMWYRRSSTLETDSRIWMTTHPGIETSPKKSSKQLKSGQGIQVKNMILRTFDQEYITSIKNGLTVDSTYSFTFTSNLHSCSICNHRVIPFII